MVLFSFTPNFGRIVRGLPAEEQVKINRAVALAAADTFNKVAAMIAQLPDPPPPDPTRIERDQRKRELLACVAGAVEQAFGVSLADLTKYQRARKFADARSAFYHLANTECDVPQTLTGKFLNGRDHSTVISGSVRATGLLKTDKEWAALYMKARDIIRQTCNV